MIQYKLNVIFGHKYFLIKFITKMYVQFYEKLCPQLPTDGPGMVHVNRKKIKKNISNFEINYEFIDLFINNN